MVEMLPFMAVHPINAPILNVIPRKACGHHVIRFISGYVAISGSVIKPRTIVVVLSCSKMINPNNNNDAKKNNAFFAVMSPFARGRFFVRSTSLSRLRSHRSLITHPAPRMMIAPIAKSATILIVSGVVFSIPPCARNIPHKHGKRRSHIPTGRSRRSR